MSETLINPNQIKEPNKIEMNTAVISINEIKADTNYVFTNKSITSITLSGCEESYKQTTIQFSTNVNAPEIVDNSGISWNQDLALLKPFTDYIIFIVNKIGIVQKYNNTSNKELNATVIGSLDISNNFIVKGFSASNNLQIDTDIQSTDSFELQLKYQRLYASGSSTENLIMFGTQQLGISTTSHKWWLWFSNVDEGASSNNFLDLEKWIWVRVKYDTSTSKIKVDFSFTGEFDGEEKTMFDSSVSQGVDINNIYITTNTLEYMSCEIDMKECWLKINNSFAWTGVVYNDQGNA